MVDDDVRTIIYEAYDKAHNLYLRSGYKEASNIAELLNQVLGFAEFRQPDASMCTTIQKDDV